jgi:hypothetical protein
MRRVITCSMDEDEGQVTCVESEERDEPLKVLFLDDDPQRVDKYEREFPDHDLVWAKSPYVAAGIARVEPFDVVSMDYNLEFFGLTGLDAATMLGKDAGASSEARFVVHSMNPLGARRMTAELKEGELDVVRTQFWDPAYFKLIAHIDDPSLPAPRSTEKPASMRKRVKSKLPYVAVGLSTLSLLAVIAVLLRRKK